jgi:hypothetical protein
MILLGLIFLALTQLYYLHRGLKLVSTSVLYPLVFCIYNIIAILDGLIYFRQTDKLSALHAGLIALGTVILLSGVLALSWRLSDEQTQPAVAQSALAPGLGLVEDTDNEYDEISTPDEEAVIGVENERLLNGEPMTPTTKLDTVLGATRKVRKAARRTEADEIWGELHDDAKASPPRPPRRASTVQITRRPTQGDEPSDETAALLRSNSSRRRRRRSTGFPGFTARPLPLSPSSRSLWRIRWWHGGSGKGPPDADQDHGAGSAGPSGESTI